MSKSRLEAFSDGVLAIIITIMVLEMKVPHGTEIDSLRPLIPVFLSYLLSFIYIGIFWSNHHHLLQAVQKVNGRILWANLHLLFWLSLIPFATGWMGENHFAAWPVLLYGCCLFMSGFAYYILERLLVSAHGENSTLVRAVGQDSKGIVSVILYLVGIGMALWQPWISLGLYILVALLWLAPDRRIEKEMAAAFGFFVLASALPAGAQPGPPVRLGAISGSLSYPSDEVPAMEVYAFVDHDRTRYQKIVTRKGQTTFLISGVVPGTYVLVAYPLEGDGLQGGYTKAVLCGLQADCKDHTLLPVTLVNGTSFGGVEIKDWYAPAKAFPAKSK